MGSLYCRTRTLCLIHANLNFFTVHVHVNVLLLNNLHMVPILDLKPSDHRDTQTNRLEFVPWKSDCPAIPNHLQIIFASSSVTLKSAKNDMKNFCIMSEVAFPKRNILSTLPGRMSAGSRRAAWLVVMNTILPS